MNRTVLISTSSFTRYDILTGYTIIKNPLKRKLLEHEMAHLVKTYNPDAIIAGVEPITEAVLQHAHALQIISRCGVGLDSIDLNSTRERQITVTNTPYAPAPAVAEMAVALMLASLRNITIGDADMKAKKWEKLPGGLLGARKIGIVGCGNIGTITAKLVSAFGATVYGYDPYISDHPICTMVSFSSLFELCDIISLHLPLTKDTHHLINKEILMKMKQGALLVNTSRGDIIDEQALFEVLQSGRIRAALDVYSEEPYNGKLCNGDVPVVLSPHQGSSAIETRIVMEEEAAVQVVRFFEKRESVL
jgi:D-3-phosphoglycerate dehydrogenase / 2-oxoglutarate reductase